MQIRSACPADARPISAIYEYYARHTAITFADHAPAAEHYAQQIRENRYPFFVAEEADEIIGFAYAGMFRPHDAYRWDAEATIYLRPECTGKGAGMLLMQALLEELKRRGFLTVYSCITIPNASSIRLHEKCGFTQLGDFPDTGYKQGKWHSVRWMEKRLGRCGGEPAEIGKADD